MIPTIQIHKVYQGVADRRQMFRMFDRHAQRPNRGEGGSSGLYAGEWFEVSRIEHDHMLEILPPLWMRDGMFAMREFFTGSVTSVFYSLIIDDRLRYFHGYCDLSERASPERMRDAIVEREVRFLKAMTREERIEHIWSATNDDYRGYADDRWPALHRGKRTVLFYGGRAGTSQVLLEGLSDGQISTKLPVHLRYLPDALAA
ncbi:DUF1419 domain-containing protein [Roseixanthobacter liquoris]|jgi:hypothetical protein|uniref:DUF1419 domain-containing protein n=1 Tax=Roseixanthobacter liquoris TaxID=3119921 RepID=UPI00372C6F20